MDFSQFDQRGRDEAGTPHPILHPDTGEPIVDPETGKPCLVLVRGPTAPSVVNAEVARNRAGMFTPEKAKDWSLPEAHDASVEVALPFIAGFQNVNRGDKPATEADAAWFLGMNLPIIGKGPDGELAIINRTFARQVCDIANSAKAEMGNAPAP